MAAAGTKQWADGPFPLIRTPASDGDVCDFLFTLPLFLNFIPHENWVLRLTMERQYTEPFTVAASHMALVHNIIIRGLNAIYIQAPHIASSDASDFLGYCKAWAEFLHAHHSGEEALYFPSIEKATGIAGIMEPNVQQHAEFSPGLKAFSEYISTSTASTFSGQRLAEIIDSFAKTLVQHLADEILTIVSLRSYGTEKVDILDIDEKEAKHVMGTLSKSLVVPFVVTALDITFEDGIHKDFPPAPAPVKFLARYLSTRFNKGCWRFAPCGNNGIPQEMFAAPERK